MQNVARALLWGLRHSGITETGGEKKLPQSWVGFLGLFLPLCLGVGRGEGLTCACRTQTSHLALNSHTSLFARFSQVVPAA